MLRSTSEPDKSDLLSIGEVAKRTGLAVSAIRFYEEQGLVPAVRSDAGHRFFKRSSVRRISFIVVSQSLGYSIREISEVLSKLPAKRTPTAKDWEKLADGFRDDLDNRIRRMQQLRDKLTGCIGCGCLSMEACALYNPGDKQGGLGSGARFLE